MAGRKIAEVSPKNVIGTDIGSMERTENILRDMIQNMFQ